MSAGLSGQTAPHVAAATPDLETSSAGYAARFAGRGGRYLLEVQSRCIANALAGVEPGTVLDVGGGHGQLVDLLHRLGWHVAVHGTDARCERNLRQLHGKRNCEFIRGDLLALPVPDRSFDAVTAVRLLSHVEEWPRLLAEMCRVARRTVLFDYPSKTALNALSPLLFGMKKALEGNTRPYASFTRGELTAELARHGFRCEREVKQLLLPMVVHRVGGGALPLRWAEAAFAATGFTALIGSPVILRADLAGAQREAACEDPRTA